MAQKTQVLLLDDIDGSEGHGTVRFALDDQDYEIDLNAKHEKEMRDALAPYVEHARIVRRPTAVRSTTTTTRSTTRAAKQAGDSTEVIRAWLVEHGYELKNRGRIPGDLIDKYNSKTPAPAKATEPEPAPTLRLVDPPAVLPAAVLVTEPSTAPAATFQPPELADDKPADDESTTPAPVKRQRKPRAAMPAAKTDDDAKVSAK